MSCITPIDAYYLRVFGIPHSKIDEFNNLMDFGRVVKTIDTHQYGPIRQLRVLDGHAFITGTYIPRPSGLSNEFETAGTFGNGLPFWTFIKQEDGEYIAKYILSITKDDIPNLRTKVGLNHSGSSDVKEDMKDIAEYYGMHVI